MDAPTLTICVPGARTPSRRLGSRAFAILATAVSLALIPAAATAAAAPARTADSFVESIGVNTHTFYSDTAYYSQFETVKQRLAELGVRHIREGLMPNRPDQYERLNQLAGIGIRSTLILGDPNNGISGLEDLISTLKTNLGGTADAVEGPNEFDTRGGADWAPQLIEYQQHLYDSIKGDPSLSTLPVIGPSIVHRSDKEALGNISGQLDYGNIHSYPNGYPPESNLSAQLTQAADNSGSKPVMATETGYHNAINWTGEHNPTSEQATSTYLPRLFLEYFREGVVRTFSYELLDEHPDPGHSERESDFGLLRNDLSEKPAFVALRNMIDILQDPGPAFTPGSLNYSLSGNHNDLRQVLLQKRDGSLYVALWRASSVWDPINRTPFNPSSTPVTLDFQRHVVGAARYMPNISPEPVAVLSSHDNRLTVSVGAQVVILKLAIGTHTQRRIRLWISKRSVPAGGRVAVKGRLPKQAVGKSLRVKIQRWQGHWRTVGGSRTSRIGIFRKAIRVPRARIGRVTRLRVVARSARPSRVVRIRVRT